MFPLTIFTAIHTAGYSLAETEFCGNPDAKKIELSSVPAVRTVKHVQVYQLSSEFAH